MKKLLVTVLTASMVMCFFGCAEKTDKPKEQTQTQTQVTVENNVTDAESENKEQYGVPAGDELGGAELADDYGNDFESGSLGGGDLSVGGGLTMED